jgi:hypothetical protein
VKRALALLLLLGACAPHCPAGTEPAVVLTAYLGRNVEPSGRCPFIGVSDRDWAAFRGAAVNPRFPAYTVADASGFWQGAAEPTLVLTVVAPIAEAPSARARLLAVAGDYRDRFCQQAVLVMETAACTALTSR